ncbi:MAG: strL [Sediminibacterium sp.]|nr:strL [Sediminibacterium sp.]
MSKKKILLFGSGGMIGHMVLKYLTGTDVYEIVDVTKTDKVSAKTLLLDIMDKAAVEKLVHDVSPDYLINCAGVLITGANKNPGNAIYLNSYFPHQLSGLARLVNAKLIHISTDCVFSGEKGNYTESDYKDGKDMYAKSKGLGEIVNDIDLTIRSSNIGPELDQNGEGLFNWFMNQKGEIKGYTNAFWSGVTTLVLAKAVHAAIEQNITGLYNLVNNDKISKYDLLGLLKKIFDRDDIQIQPFDNYKADKSLLNSRTDFVYRVPGYHEMVFEMKQWLDANKESYPFYFA